MRHVAGNQEDAVHATAIGASEGARDGFGLGEIERDAVNPFALGVLGLRWRVIRRAKSCSQGLQALHDLRANRSPGSGHQNHESLLLCSSLYCELDERG